MGLYVFGTLGINLAYHRMLTHRSLLLPKWLEYPVTTLAVAVVCRIRPPAGWRSTGSTINIPTTKPIPIARW